MDTRQFDRGQVAIGFPGAADANRNIAGVASAARAARQAIDRDARAVGLVIGDGGTLDDAAWRDIERLRGDVPVTLVAPDEAPVAVVSAQVPSAREVLLATGKASDGLISRWLNRPTSRAISALLLRYTGAKPVHATLGTAALALAMFAALLFGGGAGLVAGGLLFHAASVFDGVDGEIARATWRSSRAGASFDSAVDVAANLLFVLGLTFNLTASHGRVALALGGLSLCLLLVGFALVGRRTRRSEGQLRFEWLKQQVEMRSADQQEEGAGAEVGKRQDLIEPLHRVDPPGIDRDEPIGGQSKLGAGYLRVLRGREMPQIGAIMRDQQLFLRHPGAAIRVGGISGVQHDPQAPRIARGASRCRPDRRPVIGPGPVMVADEGDRREAAYPEHRRDSRIEQVGRAHLWIGDDLAEPHQRARQRDALPSARLLYHAEIALDREIVAQILRGHRRVFGPAG